MKKELKMIKTRVFLHLSGIILFAAGLSFAKAGNKSTDTLTSDEAQILSATTQKKVPLTYIDTLNIGSELGVHPPAKVEPITETNIEFKPKVAPLQSPAAKAVRPPTMPSSFRVQCYALSQRTKAAEKERLLKNSISENKVYTITESSLYKVMVGDFSTREQADSMSIRLKHMGFWDAFVVSTTINP